MITQPSGGSGDFEARVIAQGIAGPLGQPVVVDNRPTTVIGAEMVYKAPPDGHILLVTSSSFWIGTLFEKLSYDPIKDFLPITIVTTSPNVLTVHPSLPVKSVRELIALAKAKPGELNYGSGATGSSSHLPGALFNSLAHVKLTRVPYKSATLAMNDLLGGQVQLMFASAGAVGPYAKSGRLRAVAVTSAAPYPLTPGLPTVSDSGLPGYEFSSFDCIFVRAGTPPATISRLNREIVRYLITPDVKQKFLLAGMVIAGSTPDELAKAVTNDMNKWTKLIADDSIREY